MTDEQRRLVDAMLDAFDYYDGLIQPESADVDRLAYASAESGDAIKVMRGQNDRLRKALVIALECLETTGGYRGPSAGDCVDAADAARAELEDGDV